MNCREHDLQYGQCAFRILTVHNVIDLAFLVGAWQVSGFCQLEAVKPTCICLKTQSTSHADYAARPVSQHQLMCMHDFDSIL